MVFPQKIELPIDIYNQDSITLSQINLFFGTNGTGKSQTLKIINKRTTNNFIIDENRFFSNSVMAQYHDHISKSFYQIQNYDNLIFNDVLEYINTIFQQLFPNRKLIKTSPIGSHSNEIGIQKNGKNYAIGSDGRGLWNIIKPLEALYLSNENQSILVEEFSVGLFPGFLNKYYELIKNEILKKGCMFVTTTQDPFVVYQFIKNKINDQFEWEDNEPEVSLFKFSENENGKTDIVKIDENSQTGSLKELLGSYTEGMDMMKFFHLFSKDDDRLKQ